MQSSSSSTQKGAILAAALVASAGVAAAVWAAHGAGRAAARRHKKVFVLAVSLTFADVAERDKWVEQWLPMVEQVRRNEPGTLSYELLVGDTDPLKAMVYERYVDRAAYQDVHRTSEAMLKFKEAVKGIHVTVQGQTYIESNKGFM